MRLLKVLWERWKVIGHKIGDFQARLILLVFYFVFLAPFALGVKLFSDPLRLKGTHGWLLRADEKQDLQARSQRQF